MRIALVLTDGTTGNRSWWYWHDRGRIVLLLHDRGRICYCCTTGDGSVTAARPGTDRATIGTVVLLLGRIVLRESGLGEGATIGYTSYHDTALSTPQRPFDFVPFHR
jgi:hypothetical protein